MKHGSVRSQIFVAEEHPSFHAPQINAETKTETGDGRRDEGKARRAKPRFNLGKRKAENRIRRTEKGDGKPIQSGVAIIIKSEGLEK